MNFEFPNPIFVLVIDNAGTYRDLVDSSLATTNQQALDALAEASHTIDSQVERCLDAPAFLMQ